MPRNSTSSVTGFVTPRMVRSPSIWNCSFVLPGITLVLLNVMVGYFSTQKKSCVRRWLSRRSFCVLMLLSGIDTSTVEAARFSGSNTIVPS